MKRLLVGLTAACALAATPAAAATTTKPSGFDYTVIGDTPYGEAMLAAFPSQIAQINADPTSRLVMHLGDIKSGSTRCDTSYFELIRSNFDRFDDPLVYTPGDNEWTDCHRANNGGYQPAGAPIAGAPVTGTGPSRLDEVRRVFFDRPGRTLGQHSRKVESQRGLVENVRWAEGGALFATAHVVGSNNDLAPWFGAAETPALTAARLAEYKARNAADLRWLDETFLQALLTGAKGVAIGIQADMWDPAITGDPAGYSGFTPFVKRLAFWSKLYGRPVLLLNGDSHVYEADHPLGDHTALNNTIYGVDYDVPNLSRVTVDGSAQANDYLNLHVDTKTSGVFSYERISFAAGG